MTTNSCLWFSSNLRPFVVYMYMLCYCAVALSSSFPHSLHQFPLKQSQTYHTNKLLSVHRPKIRSFLIIDHSLVAVQKRAKNDSLVRASVEFASMMFVNNHAQMSSAYQQFCPGSSVSYHISYRQVLERTYLHIASATPRDRDCAHWAAPDHRRAAESRFS